VLSLAFESDSFVFELFFFYKSLRLMQLKSVKERVSVLFLSLYL
jgi:hypothetical protein